MSALQSLGDQQRQPKEHLQYEKRQKGYFAQKPTAAPVGHDWPAPAFQHLFINPRSETSPPH
jgi:hypothetical protein